MDYDKLVKEIRKQGDTKIPGLLANCVKECYRRRIFANRTQGIITFVKKILAKEIPK